LALEWVETVERSAQEREPMPIGGVRVLRGEGPLLGDGLAHDAQRGSETHAIGVVAGVFGGLGHQRSNGVVAAQMSPNLLQGQIGGF